MQAIRCYNKEKIADEEGFDKSVQNLYDQGAVVIYAVHHRD
jgi:uncharacterized protein YihD (DUF1040 family)